MDTNPAINNPTPNISIEFHDSRLSALSLRCGGGGVMSFKHLNVFIEKSRNEYEVWSYQADLLLEGITQLSIDEMLGDSDYICDGNIVDIAGCEVELTTVTEWTQADKIELIFSSSGKLSLTVSQVQLSLITALKKLEDWSGPLKS
jgi:hypothetical protein